MFEKKRNIYKSINKCNDNVALVKVEVIDKQAQIEDLNVRLENLDQINKNSNFRIHSLQGNNKENMIK